MQGVNFSLFALLKQPTVKARSAYCHTFAHLSDGLSCRPQTPVLIQPLNYIFNQLANILILPLQYGKLRIQADRKRMAAILG